MSRFYRLFAVAGVAGWVALALLLGLTPGARAASPQSMAELVRSDQPTLDALYANGWIGPIPTGFLPGRVIVDPGSRRTVRASRLLHVVWQGKVFHGDGTGHNRVFGITAIPVQVYHGQSWRDGGPALIVDYTGSRLFGNVRDEIREVSPGLYLGLTYVQKRHGLELAMMFTLQQPAVRCAR